MHNILFWWGIVQKICYPLCHLTIDTKQHRHHQKQLSETISYALPDLFWLSIIFLILFTGFLLALRLLVGPGVAGYADFIDG
jgi:hypothetical protein